MHRALEIQEILLSIFDYCYSPITMRNSTSDLSALARTCRTFKEPALDVLWEELDDLLPLVGCLPEVTRRCKGGMYSITAPLAQTDLEVLQSYTRRIRSIVQLRKIRVDRKSLEILSSAHTTEPLFAKLHSLCCDYTETTEPLLHLSFPSLALLDLQFGESFQLLNYLNSCPIFSPNFSRLTVRLQKWPGTIIDFNYSSQWQNLKALDCPHVALDTNTLSHLSRMPTLTRLAFWLGHDQSIPNPPLIFPYLRDIELTSRSLGTISEFLSQIRLLAVTSLTAAIPTFPSKLSRQVLTSFLTSLCASGVSDTIQALWLDQPPALGSYRDPDNPQLGLDDLWPCMGFNDLRCLEIDISWDVDLTDNDLLTLASAWPLLEEFQINLTGGWKTRGGITPGGLTQVLQMCPLLHFVAIAIDTRSHDALPRSPEEHGWTLPPTFSLDVLDSVIKRDAVPAIAEYFANIAPPSCADVFFQAWEGALMERRPKWKAYKTLWYEMYATAMDAVRQRSVVGSSPGTDETA